MVRFNLICCVASELEPDEVNFTPMLGLAIGNYINYNFEQD